LTALNYLQASGPLDRRGVEVDHNFYSAAENKKLAMTRGTEFEADEPEMSRSPAKSPAAPQSVARDDGHVPATALSNLQADHGELRGRVDALEVEVRRLMEIIDDLVRDLRG
jgi:hypothetical protein